MSQHDRPDVTVLTIVAEDPAGFVSTARSVVQQRDVRYEYVVKDGSRTPDTRRAVEAFGDFVDRAEFGPDGGIYPAFNRGVALARGTWVLFLNAGDRLRSPDALRDLLAATDDDVDILHSFVLELETGARKRYLPPKLYWMGMTFDHQSCLVRRSLLEELGGFDESFRIAGDLDLFSRARVAGARFREVELEPVIKPFARGMSSSYARRFAERRRALERSFGDAHPVTAKLTEELRTQVARRGLVVPPDADPDTLLKAIEDADA